MLKEVKQPGKEGERRWFSDDAFDLVVWYQSGSIVGVSSPSSSSLFMFSRSCNSTDGKCESRCREEECETSTKMDTTMLRTRACPGVGIAEPSQDFRR
jgi:hypothetical protein